MQPHQQTTTITEEPNNRALRPRAQALLIRQLLR
jgi:hypothetical protein